MPYKDPEKKKKAMRRWRRESIKSGYGKWLYRRRKLRFDNEERFRAAIEWALETLSAISPRPLSEKDRDRLALSIDELERALHKAREAEEALGRFEREEKE